MHMRSTIFAASVSTLVALGPTGPARAQSVVLASAERTQATQEPVALPARSAPSSDPTEALDAQIAAASALTERLGAERRRVEAEVEGLVEQRGAAQRRLRTRFQALYRMRRAGLLPLAGGFDALLRHQSRVERLTRMVRRDIDALRSFERRVEVLRQETARIASDAERADVELRALVDRRGVLERAASAWALGGNPYAEVRPLDAPPSLGFARLRGQLPLPVEGSVRSQEAEREGGAGLDLLVSAGVPVRAVAPGRVAYAAHHPGYGRLVIVDHGGGFYTVYGGLGPIVATVGQGVDLSTPLSTSAGPPVFFQVRQGTRPLPPREWLGL